jgi:methionine-rich copper-binding protein CopC
MKNLPIYLLVALLTFGFFSTTTFAANEITPTAITAAKTIENAPNQAQTSTSDEINPDKKTKLTNKEKRQQRKEKRAKRGGGLSDGVYISGGALLVIIILLIVLI